MVETMKRLVGRTPALRLCGYTEVNLFLARPACAETRAQPQTEETNEMANDDRTSRIPRRTPKSAATSANVKRAMAYITTALNRLTFNDADEVRALFSD